MAITPSSAEELIRARQNSRWSALKESLDWTRYHLQVALVAKGDDRSLIAAGLFERLARFHSCAGALPVEATAIDGIVSGLPVDIVEHLDLARYWTTRQVDALDTNHLHFYDVVACIDAEARESLIAGLPRDSGGVLPAHVVDLGDFGAYLENRRVESPIKAWVPDWREELDPDYDDRQAVAEAPRDDALAVWYSMPEDLARLVQPRYTKVSTTLSAADMCGSDGSYGGDDDAAVLSFHLAGLVRFLMDSYPLDLQGGPGYIPM